MIAPEPATGSNLQSGLPQLLIRTLALSALIFALLEIWRPYFFLTDDNLDGTLPFFHEMGTNLLAGQSPFVAHHLFGGGYNFLRDPSYFVWHPVYLLISLLAGTPFHNSMVEVAACFHLLLATAGFTVLANHLRRELALPIGNRWITFYVLSYTYTMIALTTGASWLTFLGNVSALPWLALGILQKSWWRGGGLVALFTLHHILGGHLAPTVSDSLFLTLFSFGIAFTRRSVRPLVNWLGGYALALLILLPLLLPMLSGFAQSYRAGGITLEDMQDNNIPAIDFLPSIFLGMALWLTHPHEHPYVTYTLALGAGAAAWCLLPALASRARWQGLQVVTLALLGLSVVLIIRPVIITEGMMHLPLLRSMRWPFREFVQFQFFLHLFLITRPAGLSFAARRLSAAFGSIVYIIPLLCYPYPPSFNAMTWDRELVISGGAQHYWEQVRTLLQPDDRIAVLIPQGLYGDDRFEEPYSLLGSYNYAALAGVINAWGYSPTAPRDQLYTKTYAYYPFGAYLPTQKTALLAEKPDLKFITLESLKPLRITLSSRTGPAIDLTPFVPPRQSLIPGEAILLHGQL